MIIENRKSKLKDYLNNIKLDNWDKIIIRYIGTKDFWLYPEHQNKVLEVVDNVIVKNYEENIIRYRYLENKYKNTFTIYYDSKVNNYDNTFKAWLINEVFTKIDEVYKKWEYNRWSYLIESIYNYSNF